MRKPPCLVRILFVLSDDENFSMNMRWKFDDVTVIFYMCTEVYWSYGYVSYTIVFPFNQFVKMVLGKNWEGPILGSWDYVVNELEFEAKF